MDARVEGCVPVSKYDSCVDYETFLKLLTWFYFDVKDLYYSDEIRRKHTLKIYLSYSACVLIMAINGLRIREALRASQHFYETGERVFYIRALKGGDVRKVFIPEFIDRSDLEYIYIKLRRTGEDNVRRRVENWVRGMFNINLHGVRYAFIRHYYDVFGKEALANALGLRDSDNIKRYYLRGFEEFKALLEIARSGGVSGVW